MKKRKIVMSVLIVTMLASCMACGNIKDHKGETLKNSVTEKVTVSNTEVAEDTENIEPVDIKIDDLKPLADAGVITGVEDIIVPEGTDVNLNELVYADKNIVKSVDIDDSAVDYSKAGTYEVIYTITFDGEKLRNYVKENNLNVNFDTNDKTIVVKTKVTITVATEEDTEKAIASGNTNVVTPETKESVAESNKAKANDNAVTSKSAEKPAGNTSNSNASKHENSGNSGNNNANAGNNSNSNSSNNSGNAGNNGNSGNNGNHNGNSNGNNGNHNGNNNSNNGNHNDNNKPTEKPHVHKYNSGVVTKAPTCTDTGVKTYTCVDGDDSYTETISALGHDYVTHTETVTVKEAWDEDVYESRYICYGCGASFETAREVGRHILAVPNDTCGSYYVDDVKVNTIHHPAETETRTYKVCSRCGDTVK